MPSRDLPARPKQSPARGFPVTLAQWWRDLAKEKQDEKGWSHTQLAEKARLEHASDVTRMYQDKSSSRVVAKVAKALGIIDPIEALLSETNQTWVSIGMRLRMYEPAHFQEVFEALQKLADKAEAQRGAVARTKEIVKKIASEDEDLH